VITSFASSAPSVVSYRQFLVPAGGRVQVLLSKGFYGLAKGRTPHPAGAALAEIAPGIFRSKGMPPAPTVRAAMETLRTLIDFVLHLNVHLADLVAQYGAWVYAILFLILFCETGLVVTPILPGDSLLFAAGAIAAAGQLNLAALCLSLMAAAILGDTVNYWIGYKTGHFLPRKFPRVIKQEYLDRTHAFFERYGGKTIIIARFVPIVRTFAPFVAGAGSMTYGRFFTYNVVGGVLWVGLIVPAGYFFADVPVVKRNFGVVILGIIVLSVLPAVFEFLKEWRRSRRSGGRNPH
jgi:membrane-associated protein